MGAKCNLDLLQNVSNQKKHVIWISLIYRHLLDTRTFFLLHFSIFSSTRFQCHYIYGLTFHHIQPWDLNFQHQITAPIHTRPQTSSHTTLGKQLPALDFCPNTHMALHPCTRAMLEQYGNFSNPNLQWHIWEVCQEHKFRLVLTLAAWDPWAKHYLGVYEYVYSKNTNLICRSACECLRPWLLAPNSPYIHACKHISAGSLVCHTAVEDNFKVQLPCISTRIGKYKQQVTGNKYGWEFSRIRWQVIGIRLQVTGIEDQQ